MQDHRAYLRPYSCMEIVKIIQKIVSEALNVKLKT